MTQNRPKSGKTPALRVANGQRYERVAAQYLQRQGFRIVARNWRCIDTEIDLIAWDRETLVFIEVRGKRGRAWGDPLESVGWKKRQSMRRGALAYLARHPMFDGPIRFDIVAVREENGVAKVELVPNAFN